MLNDNNNEKLTMESSLPPKLPLHLCPPDPGIPVDIPIRARCCNRGASRRSQVRAVTCMRTDLDGSGLSIERDGRVEDASTAGCRVQDCGCTVAYLYRDGGAPIREDGEIDGVDVALAGRVWSLVGGVADSSVGRASACWI